MWGVLHIDNFFLKEGNSFQGNNCTYQIDVMFVILMYVLRIHCCLCLTYVLFWPEAFSWFDYEPKEETVGLQYQVPL